MPKFFVTQKQINENNIKIIGQDVRHIKNVLRKAVGDEIIICDNTDEKDYLCRIDAIEKEIINCKIIKKLEEHNESNIQVTIFQGLPKFDKMELIIQKSVELGVYDIVPTEMKRCIVKLQEKDKEKKTQRWNKIAEVAAKQCGRSRIPKIQPIIKLKEIQDLIKKYDIFLIANENEQDTSLRQILEKLKIENKNENLKVGILIGPEGGIANEEIESLKDYGALTISLGKRILRTETVALNVLSIIMYELENQEEDK